MPVIEVEDDIDEIILDHTPDELEAELARMMDSSDPVWPLRPSLVSNAVGFFTADFPRRELPPENEHCVTPKPELMIFPVAMSPSSPLRGTRLDFRVPFGAPDAGSHYPVETHVRNIAVAVVRTDNNDIDTWIVHSNHTVEDLRHLCIDR